MREYENTKIFLLKAMLQIGLKKFLRLKKLKIQTLETLTSKTTYLIMQPKLI